jgi:hypothetical protein
MWLKVIRIINKYCKSHFFSFPFLEKGFGGRKGKEVLGGGCGGLRGLWVSWRFRT